LKDTVTVGEVFSKDFLLFSKDQQNSITIFVEKIITICLNILKPLFFSS